MCDRVLDDPAITREKAQLRAVALQILGEAYMSAKKEDTTVPPGSRFGDDMEYVRVDTKSSRAKESQQNQQQHQSQSFGKK